MYNQEFDLYLSFAAEDSAKVQHLVEELEWAGIKVWMRHQPEATADSIAVLNETMHEGRAHLVVWSKDAAASGRIQSETRTSSEKGRLIAARIDAVLPPKGTVAHTYADLVDWQGGQDHRGMKKLLYAIHQLTGKGVAPDPAELQLASETALPTEWDMLSDPEKDDRAWEITLSYNNKTYLASYLKHFPKGAHAIEAKKRLEKMIRMDKLIKKRTGTIIIAVAILFFIGQIILSILWKLAQS